LAELSGVRIGIVAGGLVVSVLLWVSLRPQRQPAVEPNVVRQPAVAQAAPEQKAEQQPSGSNTATGQPSRPTANMPPEKYPVTNKETSLDSQLDPTRSEARDKPSTPPMRAKQPPPTNDRVVVDGKLMWTRTDKGDHVYWNVANQYCKELTLNGLSGWRMPSIDELTNLYDPNSTKYNKIREPEKDEIEACAPRLAELVQMVEPKVIIGVGKVAVLAQRPDYSIEHPASLLRMDKDQFAPAYLQCVTTLMEAFQDAVSV
jgi:hypothetical protein